MRDAGFERPAFDTIVASGPNAALPHYRAGDRLLERRRPGGAGLWRRLGRILQRLDANGRNRAAVRGSAPRAPGGARGAAGGHRRRQAGHRDHGCGPRPRGTSSTRTDWARRLATERAMASASTFTRSRGLTRPRAGRCRRAARTGDGLHDRAGRLPPGLGGRADRGRCAGHGPRMRGPHIGATRPTDPRD